MEVPDIVAFRELAARVDRVEAENEFLKSLLLGQRWLNRVQAMTAIGCSDDTLRRLAVAKKVAYRYVGKKPYYDVFSIRIYLTAQKIDEKQVNERLLNASITA